MYYLISNVTINPADFRINASDIKTISPEMMNKYPNVLIPVRGLKDLELLTKRSHYQFYHKNCTAYCLMIDRREIWTLESTLQYLKELQDSISLSKLSSWESTNYSKQIAQLYSQACRVYGHDLPKWGSDELLTFLRSYVKNHNSSDYRSQGREFHVEKDHFYRFAKMSDFLNPDDVYFDGRDICWSTTKDRASLKFFETELEDLLHEFIAIVWTYRKTGCELNQPVIDATSSEDAIASAVHDRMVELFNLTDTVDEDLDELATLINLHPEIFREVKSELGLHF